jgi:hypothetical protein
MHAVHQLREAIAEGVQAVAVAMANPAMFFGALYCRIGPLRCTCAWPWNIANAPITSAPRPDQDRSVRQRHQKAQRHHRREGSQAAT